MGDRGHVMIFSLWDDVEVNMLWLDSAFPLDKPETDPGVRRGDCIGGESSTPTYLRENYPNGYVSFTNAAIGEIGSTVPGITTTKAPTKAPTKSPTGFPNGCYSINNKDCIHPGFDASSCTKTWLPNGARNDCVVLGGEVPLTSLLAVNQPNVWVTTTTLLVFRSPKLHLILPSPQLLLLHVPFVMINQLKV